MTAYYNENDSFAAEWLRNLIKAGHIADGVVDERSIVDVEPADLADYTQCHFFAGVGGWSLALRNAGWSDDRPIWTGSCPCQPFSSAGKGSGFDDERHLWPAFEWLIRECRPATVIGEQVASKDAEPWVDLVQADMEALGYAFGAVPFPSAGIGAPHIRDRLYWLADSQSYGHQRAGEFREPSRGHGATYGGPIGRMDHADDPGLEGFRGGYQTPGGQPGQVRPIATGCTLSGLADSDSNRYATNVPGSAREAAAISGVNWPTKPSAGESGGTSETICDSRPTGPVNGRWADADWLFCRDGKWRPVEPGTFPLANGIAARVGRLRAYGNAINAEQARVFIEAVMECIPQC